jgi:DNA polymerase-3 subunit alpha
MAALMTSVLDNLTKLSEYISECSKYKISVLSPNINKSGMNFTASDGNILFGLLALKNIGRQFVEKIIEERSEREYSGLDDFVDRMVGIDLNKRMVEALIKSGAFDGLNATRSSMLASYEKLIDIAAQKTRNNLDGQLDIFSMASDNGISDSFEFPKIPEFSLKEKLMLEKEASGMYFSGHILDSYSKNIEAIGVTPLPKLYALEGEIDKLAVKIAIVINSVTLKTTKKNEKMAFVAVEDRYAEGECILFSARYAAFSHLLRKDNAVVISGTLSFREDEAPKILVNDIKELVDNAEYDRLENKKAQEAKKQTAAEPAQSKSISLDGVTKIYLRVDNVACEKYKRLENMLSIFDGEVKVIIYDISSGKYLSTNIGVALTPYVLGEIEAIIGKENVALR